MGDKDINDLWSFNVNTKSWKQITDQKGDVPGPRSFHKMAAIGDCLYVFGGCGMSARNSLKSGRLSDLHKFDTKI